MRVELVKVEFSIVVKIFLILDAGINSDCA